MTKERKLTPYLLWSFGIAWVLQFIAAWFFAKGNNTAYQLMIVLTMFAPLVGALLSGASIRTLGWKPQIKRNWKIIILACVSPMLLTVLGAALYYAILPAAFDPSGSYIAGTVGEEAMAQLTAQGMTLPLYGIINAIQAITWAPFFNMIPALGEEVGWRGVMYPALKNRFGTCKGRILGGVIWGAWHWPIMILAGYEYGTGYWGAPISGMVMFCIFTVAAGILLDWFYEKSDSIWLPALAHGAINAAGSVPLVFLSNNYAGNLLVGPAPIGLIAGLPMLIVAAIICHSTRLTVQ